MFEESSSDEEEANFGTQASAPAPTPAPATAAKPAAEDKDDDDDDDDLQDSDKEMKNAPAEATDDKKEDEEKEDKKEDTRKKMVHRSIHDDSDDEGDAEYDGGAVVGSVAPEKPAAAAEEVAPTHDSAGVQLGSSRIPKPPQRATVLEADRPSDSVSLHMTKLPNLVAIQPEAFEPDQYDPDEEEEQFKGFVNNMVRWRYKRDDAGNFARDDNGKLLRESNARIVKWEDGSFTMHIGNDVFEVDAHQSGAAGAFSGLNGYIYLSQKATFAATEEDTEETPGGTVLECMGQVNSRLTARPSSLQSEAHKSLTVAVRQRTIKKARIAQYVTQEDPERAKQERIKYNEDAEKIQSNKSKNSYSNKSRTRQPGMNRGYLEEDDGEYDDINIKRMKKGGEYDDDMDDYGDESDDDDGDATFRNRKGKRPRKQHREEEDDEEEEEAIFEVESDDDEIAVIKAHKKKRSHQAVVEDDDDDE
jgi:RNA polymerase-associated protein LEO1